ncbi:hypothetical protein [Rubrivirga litoralis]|uniref:Lycopene cyclase domain-containing protein n=1 Tax=Rubrivirga litoralis TaxID=3075598 RepID=A0ABU3BSC7_9BACT|nr:hypothetical protein [Rubrivirga sp. F394]MDT0632205.1 hypothetical protein [Rubrivirga sp. F394]
MSERYQHVKLLLIVVGGVWLYRERRQPVFAALAALFAAVLIDDVATLHESMGLVLVAPLGLEPAYGMRARDFGEIVFLASWAVPLMVVAAVAYTRSDARARYVARMTAAAVVALAFFGVGADAFHRVGNFWVDEYGLDLKLKFVMSAFEEGGELVVTSVMVATAYALYKSLRAAREAEATSRS